MDRYKLIGDRPQDLTGGQILIPGESAEIDDQDTHNKRVIEEGLLIKEDAVDLPDPDPSPTTDESGDS